MDILKCSGNLVANISYARIKTGFAVQCCKSSKNI